jgi:small-conductance mechanosensitive channel
MIARSLRRRPARLAPLVVALLLSLAARAGEPTTTAAPQVEPEEQLDTAMVEIDGRELFPVRGSALKAADARASDIARRIAAVAADPRVRPESITTTETDLGTAIQAGGKVLVVIKDFDATLVGLSRQATAGLYARSITEAIESYRADRRPEVLLRHGLYVLGSTILFVALLWLLGWLHRRTVDAFARRYKDRLRDVKIQSVQLLQQRHLWDMIRGVLRAIHVSAVLVAFYVYASTSFELLPWTRALGRDLLHMVIEPLATLGQGFIGFIPSLVFIVVLILVVRLVLKLLRLVTAGVEDGTVTLAGFEPEWAWPTYRIARALIFVCAIVVAYPYIPGSSSLAFKGVSVFLGVVLSLGSSSVIGNLLAGYSMTYRRAFRIGDLVKVENTMGEVLEMRLLVTHVRTPKNEEVVIPNSLILNGSVVNYSSIARKEGLTLHTTVGIGYETPWRQVEAMLLVAAERTPGLLEKPRPFVFLTQLGDFCVTYELNVHTGSAREMHALYAALHRNILDVFNEHGVQIMTPAYETDPEQPKVVPKEQWYASPAVPPPDSRPR